MRRCESAKYYKRSYEIYTNNPSAHQCIHHYDYISKHSNKPMEDRTPSREYGGHCSNQDNIRSHQMNIIQNKRDRIEDIKLDENINQHKSSMNKLMSSLKSELHQISRNIKETDHKVDYYLKNNSSGDYSKLNKGRRKSCEATNNNNNDLNESNLSKTRKIITQKNVPATNGTTFKRDLNIPVNSIWKSNNENKKNDSNNNYKKKYVFDTQLEDENNRNDATNTTNKKDYPYHIDYLMNRYQSQNRPSTITNKNNNNTHHDNSNDFSVTYQYEQHPQSELGLTFTQYKYNSIYNTNNSNSKGKKFDTTLQEKIALLEEKAATSDKIMPDLVEKLNFFKQNYELIKGDKEKLEYKCSSLENELYETKKCLREEIEIKKSYLAMSNQTDDTINQYIRTIKDQENQIKKLQKDLMKREEEIQANLEEYRSDLKDFINEKETLKRTIQQFNNDNTNKFELRQLNDVIVRKDLELEQEKLLINDMKKQLEMIREEHLLEKNELIKKITKANNNKENENKQDNKLLIDNKTLSNEIIKLKQQLEFIKQKTIIKEQNDKTTNELKELKENYALVMKEYKDYKAIMDKTLEDKTFNFNEEQQKSIIQYEKQLTLDSERKNVQIKILSNELDSKKNELDSKVNEIKELKFQIDQFKQEKIEPSITSEKNMEEIKKLKQENLNHNKIIQQLTQDNTQYNEKVKELIKEKNKTDETIIQLENDIEKLSNEKKEHQTIMKELNDSKNKLQSKKKIESTIEQKAVLTDDKEKEFFIQEKKNLQSTIDKLQSDIAVYQKEFKDSSQRNEQDILQMSQENKSLQNQLETTKNMLQQSNISNEELNTKITTIKNTLQQSEQLSNQLKEQNKSQSCTNKDNEIKLNQLNIQIEILQKQISSTEEELVQSNKMINQLTTSLSAATALTKSKDNDITQATNSKTNNQIEIEQYKSESKSLNKQLINAQNEIKNKTKDNEALNDKIKALNNEIEQIKNELKIMKDKDIKTQNDLTHSLHAITKLNVEIDAITKDNDDLLTLKNKEIDILNDELTLMKANENNFKIEYDQFKESIASKQESAFSIESNLLAEKDKIANELKILQQEIQTLKDSESKLKEQNEQKQITLKHLTDSSNLIKKESESQIEKALKEKAEFVTKIQSQETIISNLNEEIKLVKEQIEFNDKQSPQLQTLLDEKEQKINVLAEENHALSIEASKVRSMEIQLQKEKKENQTTFAQLKAQMENNESLREELASQKESNQGLLDELESKREQIEQLMSKVLPEHPDQLRGSKNFNQGKDAKSDSFTDDLLGSYNLPHPQEEVDDLCQTITQCKETIMSLQTDIKEKEDEIASLLNERDFLQQEVEDFKELNAKLIQKNTDLASSKPFTSVDPENNRYRESLTNIEEIKEDDIENLKATIDNLKQIIVDKENEIGALHEKFNEDEKENQFDLQSMSRISQSSLTDAERCTKYKQRVEEYREQLKSGQEQINFLKTEIKELNGIIEKMKTFDGKITTYDEYIRLFGIAFENYKPKKKEQQDAFKKLEEHLGGNEDASSPNKNIKKGLLSKLFK